MANVLLVEPRAEVRSEIKEALVSLGFNNITETGNMRGARDVFMEMDVHLVVGESTLPEGDLGELIRQVRHQEISSSPFVVAVAIISQMDRAKAAIDAGNDDVLLRPFTTEKLKERILNLTKSRKKFVVTTEYIGPDRRNRPATEGLQIPRIDVPNPLQINFSSKAGVREMQIASKRALAIVNKQKVERHVFQVNWLMERIVPKLRDKKDNSAEDLLGRLYWVSRDLARRIALTDYVYATYLSNTLVSIVDEIVQSPDLVDEKEVELMEKIAQTLMNFCSPGRGVVAPEEPKKVNIPVSNPAIVACSPEAGLGLPH
ncbi:MAG: hypothetical protein A3G18_09810 [Rhodospirillales bacterium RIFCSPLOWO2_12_FULL_58_28]|nr:MAG: hypothetical protein A3H92_06780 [Rhodospirillales bacterium RIFCSPLOWO2_02_FULL_58_16]OHC78396.1 MAG: hypothetical protein A3G18_09810 [Rhodospirillales bacterium RIFCSPLOWO2_12_FULL_58_28]